MLHDHSYTAAIEMQLNNSPKTAAEPVNTLLEQRLTQMRENTAQAEGGSTDEYRPESVTKPTPGSE